MYAARGSLVRRRCWAPRGVRSGLGRPLPRSSASPTGPSQAEPSRGAAAGSGHPSRRCAGHPSSGGSSQGRGSEGGGGGGGGEGLLGYSPPWAARPGAPPPSKTSGLSASSEVRTFRLSLKRPEWETRRLRRLPPPPPAPAASPPPKGGGCSSRPPGLEGAAGASLAAAAGGGGAAGASLCFFLLVSDFHQGPAELPFTPARGAAVAAALSAISGSCGGRVGEESEGRLAAGHAATPPAGAPPPLGPAPGLSGRRRGPLLPGTGEAGSPPGAAGEVCPSPRELPSRGQAAGWARGEDFALRPRPAEPR